jgi:hypothetical protein
MSIATKDGIAMVRFERYLPSWIAGDKMQASIY